MTASFTVLLLASLIFLDIARPLGNVLYDHLMRFQGFRPTHDIVIIAIDDLSIQELGGWPLERRQYTTLLSQLDDDCCRPKSIGFDLLFLDPTNDDSELATQLKKHESVLPLAFKSSDQPPYSLQVTPPVSPISEAATLAHINLTFDSDGVIRGFHESEQAWLHFSLAIHSKTQQVHPVNTNNSYQRFRMVDPSVGFPVISLVDAIRNKANQTLLKDKYVLVGATAPSLGDRYPTLYSGKNNASTPGVAILASVLNASLNQSLIKVSPPWVIFVATIFPLLLTLQSLLILPPRHALALTCAISVGAILTSYTILSLADFWIDPIPLITVVLLLQMLWAWRRLEAIVDFVQNKAEDLKQFRHRTQESHRLHPSREVVLQQAKLLDHAVSSARSELIFLAAIVDEMPDSVMIFDTNNQLLLCNQKTKHLFSAYEFLEGSTLSAFAEHINISTSTLSSKDENAQEVELQKVLQLNTTMGLRDFIVKTAQLDSKVEHNVLLIILMDVTELKRSQTQRDRALQFLSHDMRTPVASILSITGQGEIRDSEITSKITHHARNLLGMMDDFILTISSEAAQYALQHVLLDNLINDALEEVSDLANSKNILLKDQSDINGIFISANPRLLLRALINLLFNAIKFSPNQGIIIIQASCDISGGYSQHTAAITITNSIATMGNSHQTFAKMQGFGLGLNFVENVIKRHSGSIEQSIPNTGIATVKISLPCEII